MRGAIFSALVAVAMVLLTACQPTPVQRALQLEEQRSYNAAVEEQTLLLRTKLAAEGTATTVAFSAQLTQTAVPIDIQRTRTAAGTQAVVRATQEPIIAAATIAAAEVAAKAQATSVVVQAKQAAETSAEATRTSGMHAATAVANRVAAEATGTAYAVAHPPWRQRYDAAALIVDSCVKAREIADRTTSVDDARNQSGTNRYWSGKPAIGTCS